MRFPSNDPQLLGPGWRVLNGKDSNWIADTNLYYPLQPGPLDIEFKPVDGYITPSIERVTFVPLQQKKLNITYYKLPSIQRPTYLPERGWLIAFDGPTNRPYSSEVSTNLIRWTKMAGPLVVSNGTHIFFDSETNKPLRFYRVTSP